MAGAGASAGQHSGPGGPQPLQPAPADPRRLLHGGEQAHFHWRQAQAGPHGLFQRPELGRTHRHHHHRSGRGGEHRPHGAGRHSGRPDQLRRHAAVRPVLGLADRPAGPGGDAGVSGPPLRNGEAVRQDCPQAPAGRGPAGGSGAGAAPGHERHQVL